MAVEEIPGGGVIGESGKLESTLKELARVFDSVGSEERDQFMEDQGVDVGKVEDVENLKELLGLCFRGGSKRSED